MAITENVIRGLSVMALTAAAGLAAVCAEPDEPEDMADGGGSLENWQFHEDIVDLPAFPDFDKLKPVRIDASHGRLEFYIDPASLKVGRDEVVLATMVITSERGARNVLFDGYRCDTREYKPIAYGDAKHTFHKIPDSSWQKIWRQRGMSRDFRRELVAVYFCDVQRNVLSRDEILELIDRPESGDDDGRVF